MRGQQPEQDPFESPFAVTILPSSNKRGRRREPAAAQPPQPAAQAIPTTQPAEASPAHDPFIDAQRPAAYAAPTGFPTPPAGYGPPAPGLAPAAPGSAPPAQGYAPPVGYGPPTAGYAPQPGYGSPQAGYGPPQAGYGPPPEYAQPAFDYSDADAAAPKHTKKVRRPLVIAVVVIVVLAALAALGAVEKARLTPAHRTATIPATLLGLPQDHSSALDAATRKTQDSLASLKDTFKNPQAAYFGRGGVPALAVIVANIQKRPSASDRQQFFAGMAKKLGATITLNPVASGPFGGTMECGAATFAGTPATMCASLDSAAYVMVIAYNKKLIPAEATTRSVISAVEH